MVQFVIFEGECFVCAHVSVSVIDIDYFHSAYFYICCPLFFLQVYTRQGSEICQS